MSRYRIRTRDRIDVVAGSFATRAYAESYIDDIAVGFVVVPDTDPESQRRPFVSIAECEVYDSTRVDDRTAAELGVDVDLVAAALADAAHAGGLSDGYYRTATDALAELEAQLPSRAHRIEVGKCGDCPFARSWQDWEGYWCEHPALAAQKRVDAGTPPTWCPLRGAVTLVAGPRRET